VISTVTRTGAGSRAALVLALARAAAAGGPQATLLAAAELQPACGPAKAGQHRPTWLVMSWHPLWMLLHARMPLAASCSQYEGGLNCLAPIGQRGMQA
jgi:hypothetical protein